MTITPNTHLPNDAYWVSTHSYNGLSQLAKAGTTQRISQEMIKPFDNGWSRNADRARKISKSILNKLNK